MYAQPPNENKTLFLQTTTLYPPSIESFSKKMWKNTNISIDKTLTGGYNNKADFGGAEIF